MTSYRCTRCQSTLLADEILAVDATCPQCAAPIDRFEVLASTAGDGGAQLDAFPGTPAAPAAPAEPVPVTAEDVEATITRALALLDGALDTGADLSSESFLDELHDVFTGLGVDPPKSGEPEDIERALGDVRAELDRVEREG